MRVHIKGQVRMEANSGGSWQQTYAWRPIFATLTPELPYYVQLQWLRPIWRLRLQDGSWAYSLLSSRPVDDLYREYWYPREIARMPFTSASLDSVA